MNKAILTGNVGNDPETKEFDWGSVVEFSLATTKRWKDKAGEKKEKTEWHQISCTMPGLVKVIQNYVSKGDKLAIVGEIQYSKYEKDGEVKYFTKINVSEMELLTPKNQTATPTAPPKVESSGDPSEVDDLPF